MRQNRLAASCLMTGYLTFFANSHEPARTQKKHNYALVVVDMEHDMLGDLTNREMHETIFNISRLLRYSAERNVPVVLLDYGVPTIPELRKGAEKAPRHANITRSYAGPGSDNGFNDTELEKILKEWKADGVVLSGIYASVCVFDTAKGALERGFKIATAGDIVADREVLNNKIFRRYGSERPFVEEESWYRMNGVYAERFEDILPLLE